MPEINTLTKRQIVKQQCADISSTTFALINFMKFRIFISQLIPLLLYLLSYFEYDKSMARDAKINLA